MSFLFAKEKTPKELAREWQIELRRQMRACDKEIRGIELAEGKTKRAVRDAAKAGQSGPARILALELARSKRAKERIMVTKSRLNSVSMQIRSQIAMARVTSGLAKSAEVMKSMNELMSMASTRDTLRDMSREMARVGLIEEMQDDLFEGMADSDEEEEAEAEIERVMAEVLGEAGRAGVAAPKGKAPATEESDPVPEETKREEEVLAKRLSALKG
eukprot:TRINITY_DN7280_c0_g1_i1.p1 TRINITY_DN7280_c0_g1~~TRINITY_DN7280_c0_g1_i1.p1  ORF type:complete len:241 (+),score=126.42 TRINITY_DN7280_c0_g1_i1:76-723(+)